MLGLVASLCLAGGAEVGPSLPWGLLELCCWSREQHRAVKGTCSSLRNRTHAGNVGNCHCLPQMFLQWL